MKRLLKRKGQAATETAFAIAFFVVFLFSIADITRIAYTWASLQYILNNSSRWGSVQTTTTNRADMVKNKVINEAAGLYVSLKASDITVSSEVETSYGFFNLKAVAPVQVSPLSGILLSVAGNNSGIYRVTAETVIRNENI